MMCLTGASLSASAPPFSLKRFEPNSPSEYSVPPAMIALCLVSDQTPESSRSIHRNVGLFSVWSCSSCVAHVILVCVAPWDDFGRNQLMLNITEHLLQSDLVCVLPWLRSYLVNSRIQELAVLADRLLFSEVYQGCDCISLLFFQYAVGFGVHL